jgi:hypothetical protein
MASTCIVSLSDAVPDVASNAVDLPKHSATVCRQTIGMRGSSQKNRLSLPTLPVVMLLGGAAGVGYTADLSMLSSYAPDWTAMRASMPGSGCDIKGNVSIETGERIYHVPGQRYYSSTRISPSYGERWFCSETEARQAGWRRARR